MNKKCLFSVKMDRLKWVFLFLCLFLVERLNAEVLCEVGFCRNYMYEVGCTATAQHCRINNATHTGLVLPSPTMCNCCEYCLPLYGENEHCSLGGAGDGITVGRCGGGLYCVAAADGNFCQRMDATLSVCHAKQDDFDTRYEQGMTGALEQRPLCDDKGRFAAFDCVPTQTCFCQSESGERLFGEVLYQGSATIQSMNCGCSRLHAKIQTSINSGLRFPTFGPRCISNGDFNPVQCIDKRCYCVNRVTGMVEGDEHINLDDEPISRLPCYNPALDLFSRFKSDDPPYNFSSPCFESMRHKMEYILESEEDGYIVDFFSDVEECLPDGTYGRVSVTVNRTKICVDEWGERIGDYEAEPNTEAYDNMDCKCATTSLLMTTSLEQPVCCSNGNFRPVQCRRGTCRCVDRDGRQVERETTDVASLSCYTEQWRIC